MSSLTLLFLCKLKMIKIEKKRLRGPNFTNSDNLLLCEVVAKYKHDIENKKIDGESLKRKQKAWLAVEKEFNSIATGPYRKVESLQQNYKNLKKKAKKNASKMDIHWDIPVTVLLENNEECNTSSESWEKVAEGTGALEDHCKKELEALRKEAETKDNCFKMILGGGSPPRSDDDPLLDKEKALVGPSFDGLQSSLATEKLELVALQKELIKCQLLEAKDKLEHNRLLQAMELEDAKKRYKHNELIRQLQLQSFNK